MSERERKVRRVLAELLGRDENEFVPSSSLADDFNVDSTEMVEIVSVLEKEFAMTLGGGAERKARTVGDLYMLVADVA